MGVQENTVWRWEQLRKVPMLAALALEALRKRPR